MDPTLHLPADISTVETEQVHSQAACFPSLPAEMVLMIAERLDDASKLCLSLSCKGLRGLLDRSGTLQRSNTFQYPGLLHPLYTGPIGERSSIFHIGRWRLLRQLEDSRYQACSGCFKLHPISEFSSHDLETVAEKRTCMFGPLVGVADLCPCLKMTLRDKVKLVKELEGSLAEERRTEQSDHTEQFWHQCSHTYGPVVIDTKISPRLEWNGDLIIDSHYYITGKDLEKELVDVPRVCCPHRGILRHFCDVVQFLGEFWHTGENVRTYDGFMKRMDCKWCCTASFDPEWRTDTQDYKRISFSFRTSKNLGGHNNLADHMWYGHTGIAFENSLDNKGREQLPCMPWLGRYRGAYEDSSKFAELLREWDRYEGLLEHPNSHEAWRKRMEVPLASIREKLQLLRNRIYGLFWPSLR